MLSILQEYMDLVFKALDRHDDHLVTLSRMIDTLNERIRVLENKG
jgi:hypothetical protein